ncbi:MAG TPA: hypothetical protein GXX33_06740 [Firmicutes bacterium]|uniref:Uncharacterized protein n=1 Tax=Capillibacterium thermochitinicola TaxID=2699427 RepID=A0A8J6LNN6_9FIRM|nr:hypothetical protein [Capillibacterium thermochitinicola]MBA2133863.1 hypothetical protein [Capillibacterium thermochitinicola]HHW12681.1 hypothetical protein [Bacillota bacterium]
MEKGQGFIRINIRPEILNDLIGTYRLILMGKIRQKVAGFNGSPLARINFLAGIEDR